MPRAPKKKAAAADAAESKVPPKKRPKRTRKAPKAKAKAEKASAPDDAAEGFSAADIFATLSGETAEAAQDETLQFDVDGQDDDESEPGAEASARLISALNALSKEPLGSVETKRREAVPENEFHVPPVGAVSIEDLMAPLQDEARFTREVKELKALSQREGLPEPASEAARGREERSIQYRKTSKDVEKWFPQVHRMNRADQVVLDSEPAMLQSTTEIVGNFAPVDDFEVELEAATRAAGASEEDLRGAKVLPMNPRIREEQQTRQVARLKALMLREQQTKRRVNKIKSKTYRRIHRKSEAKDREVLLQRLEHENPELAQQLKQDYERKHAERRLLRQRNARKKWTQTMQCFAKGDRNAQQEISKQAQKAHDEEQALRRAIAGKDAKDSDSEHVDLSDDEEGDGTETVAKSTIKKAKRLTVEEIRDLDAEGELPSTGLLGMKFMQQAIKSKREAAKQEALGVLKELEGFEKETDPKDDYKDDDDEDESKPKVHRPGDEAAAVAAKFTPEELQKARAEVDAMMEVDDNVTGFSAAEVAGPLTIRGVSAAESTKKLQPQPAKETEPGSFADAPTPSSSSRAPPPAAANPWVDENPWVSDTQPDDSKADVTTARGGKAAAKKRLKKKRKATAATEADEAEGHPEMSEGRGSEDVLAALSAETAEASEQRELVRTAFVEGTQEEDFKEELEREQEEKEERSKANSGDLPGWGSWAGEGAPKPRRPEAKAKPKAEPKRPAHIGGMIRMYDGQAEAAKYFVDKAPYGYENPKQYSQELRMPSGPEWNALPAHLQKIKPKFFSKVGAIVPPLQLVKHLPPESRAGVINTWAAARQPKRLKAKI